MKGICFVRNVIILDQLHHIKSKALKLRGFTISFSAANPCEAKDSLLTNGIKRSQALRYLAKSTNNIKIAPAIMEVAERFFCIILKLQVYFFSCDT
jgi:hypothetical protein